ncbi:hypothetical protein BB561_003847 [Smittium simulii]|uniref:PCI domain-containing protein n=1 Tax=Smittium simulii TaxID=133385 RepID=A0A2T9YJ76_9FUNG|nr:hypothetical protein BB561_003847 [Smittium simulii]
MDVDTNVHEYLKNLEEQVPSELAKLCSDFAVLYDRKFWHQLTEKSALFLQDPNSEPHRLSFYLNFICDWQSNMNKIKLVTFAIIAAKQFKDVKDAENLLLSVAEKVDSLETQDAYAMAKLEQAHFKLLQNDIDSTQTSLKEADKIISALPKVDASVHASYYRVSADYYKVKAKFGDYYKNALLYLSCIKLEDLSSEQIFERVHDLAISALLSDTIYNFGDLLSHPIIETLRDSDRGWMYELLVAFNNGDIIKLDNLLNRLKEQPILFQHQDFLKQKMRLMALVETVFKKQGSGKKNEQSIPFKTLAQDIKVTVGEIEHLVMLALSLGLVYGKIDEISQSVDFQWVQPRYLDKNQIKNMGSKLLGLSERIDEMTANLDSQITCFSD